MALMAWQKEFPQEEGDWLWVNMWDCACCVQQSGIAWIYEVHPEDNDLSPIYYQNKNGKWLGISWEGQKPYFLDKEEKQPDITAWMKVGLPPGEWSDETGQDWPTADLAHLFDRIARPDEEPEVKLKDEKDVS